MPLKHEKPNVALMAELKEVATAAAALSDAIGKANAPLPEAFPEEQLQAMLAKLAKLPQATAEGCFGPLDAARRRLPIIRLRHILREAAAPASKGDAPPPLLRKERIDQTLGELTTAVGTALAEYHHQANEEYQPEDEAAPELDTETAAEAEDAADASDRFADNWDKAASETRDAAISERADRLARTEQSAANEAGVAAAEARMPDPQPQLLTRMAGRIESTGVVIEEIGHAIDPLVDIVERAHKWWESVEEAVVKTAVKQTRTLGQTLQFTGRRLQRYGQEVRARRAERAEQQMAAPDDDPEVPADVREAAEARVRAAVLAGDIPASADARLTRRLDISGEKPTKGKAADPRQIPRPALIGDLMNLRVLEADRTDIAHLSFIEGLSNLHSLNMNDTQVADLVPLAGLKALHALRLDGTQVADLTPLAGLEGLQNLWLDGTKVADLTPLSSLAALQNLWLGKTQVSDLAPIAELEALETLTLNNTQVADLTPLAGLEALRSLWLNNTQVTDLAPLAGLKVLQILWLINTQVADLTPLAGLETLQNLLLDGTKVADLAPLAGLKALQELWLNSTEVADLTPLAGLEALQELWLNSTQVVDFAPVAHVRNIYGHPDRS